MSMFLSLQMDGAKCRLGKEQKVWTVLKTSVTEQGSLLPRSLEQASSLGHYDLV